jgi:hypothetical protein
MKFLFEYSIARPPNSRERAVLARRHERLQSMAKSVIEATAHLEQLVTQGPLDAVRIRHGFVRRPVPADEDTSDRSAPAGQHRPSSTRLMSPNGIALPFELIALLEAQSRTNSRPLRGTASEPGWTQLIATAAAASGEGRHRMSIVDKKLRQLQQTLNRLYVENLIDLPHADHARGKHENFLLMREDGARDTTNDLYYVPEHDYFTIPTTLFTNGWIYVLEDSELALLLITARMREQHGDEGQRLGATNRALFYGLGRDSFEAHRVLDYLGIIDVMADIYRNEDGKVDGFKSRGAQPHELLFHPEALDRPALPTLLDTIASQIEAGSG